MATITFLCWFNAYQMYIFVSGNANQYYMTRDKYHKVSVIGEILTPVNTKFCEDYENE